VKIAERFAQTLARTRRRKGLSQEALSVRASVHRTEISQLERGLRTPRIDTLVKLAAGLEALPANCSTESSGSPGRPSTAASTFANRKMLRCRPNSREDVSRVREAGRVGSAVSDKPNTSGDVYVVSGAAEGTRRAARSKPVQGQYLRRQKVVRRVHSRSRR